MSHIVQTEERPGGAEAGPTGTGFGWRRLQVAAAFGVIGSFLVPMVISFSFEGFLVAMLVPFVIGLLLMLRVPRVGAIWLGVASLGVLLFSSPFLVEALSHPESPVDFLPLTVFTISTLVGSISAIPSVRLGREPDAVSRPARTLAVGSGAAVLVAVAVSFVAFSGVESVPARAGDIGVVTEDLVFVPGEIDALAGTVALHVTNRDDTRHTITIDELEVDLNIPPNTAQRVSFSADRGTYRFYCRPHAPGMEGLLVVE